MVKAKVYIGMQQVEHAIQVKIMLLYHVTLLVQV